jgi:hypothetical protein
MNYDDHNPPHFHVEYEEWKAIIRISDMALLKGGIPPRAFGLVVEWASRHKEELLADWNYAKEMKPPLKIQPLE